MGIVRICRVVTLGIIYIFPMGCANDDCSTCPTIGDEPWVEVLSPVDGDTTSVHRFDVQVRFSLELKVSKVQVLDENDRVIGGFKQKLFSIGGAFTVLDASDTPVCQLKGKWTGWDFRFLAPGDVELAHVSKKWAGLGKEMFTSADNYMLEISDSVPADSPIRQLILAAVTSIDMVLKE